TDDLLVLKKKGAGFSAYPGPARIKLFPHVAKRFLGDRVTRSPMTRLTRKLVIPIESPGLRRSSTPLRVMYALSGPGVTPPRRLVSTRLLSQRRACLKLLANTFNVSVTDPSRLRRQLVFVGELAARVPVKTLSYPRSLAALPNVRDAILSDLG